MKLLSFMCFGGTLSSSRPMIEDHIEYVFGALAEFMPACLNQAPKPSESSDL